MLDEITRKAALAAAALAALTGLLTGCGGGGEELDDGPGVVDTEEREGDGRERENDDRRDGDEDD